MASKKGRRHGFIGAVALFLSCILLLPGCSIVGMDVEAQLRPPRGTGEQQEVLEALEAYIEKNADKGSAKKYTLIYPNNGEYRSAFVMEDFDGDGEDEAYAFYRIGNENTKIRLNYLKKQDGTWRSIADIEGLGSEIDQVVVANFYNSSKMTLCLGWQVFSTRDYKLQLYTMDAAGLLARDVGTYSTAVVEDMTGSGKDNILLLYAGSDNNVTARLWEWQNEALTERSTISLDGSIQSFSNVQKVQLADGVPGIFVDGTGGSTTVTELIYWNGERLYAPFYDASTNETNLTARFSTIPSMDIDGDGMVEWPQCTRINGHGTSNPNESSIWITEWFSWDYENQKVFSEFTSVVNMKDGYCLRADKTFWDSVTTYYDSNNHTLSIYTYDSVLQSGNPYSGEMILSMRATGTSSVTTSPAENSSDERPLLYRTVTTVGGIRYSVWFTSDNSYNLTMEGIRYMLTVLPH